MGIKITKYAYYINIAQKCLENLSEFVYIEHNNLELRNPMDQTDRKILAILYADGRTPYTEIAKSLAISEATVRNRVARLVENKILQVIGMVDPYQLGYDAPAMIGVSIDPPLLENAAEEIAAFPEVSYLVMVSGEFDLLVEVMCRNRQELTYFLNQKLHCVDGVNNTQSSLILKTYKNAYGAQPSSSFISEEKDE